MCFSGTTIIKVVMEETPDELFPGVLKLLSFYMCVSLV